MRPFSVDVLPAYVTVEGDCWIWARTLDRDGYGRVGAFGRGTIPAHRAVYELLLGEPPGPEVDHLCRRRSCVNPDHLEPVSHRQNMERIARRYCHLGHLMSGENLYTGPNGSWRQCRACGAARARDYYQRTKENQ